MGSALTKLSIDAAIARALDNNGTQVELRDEREPGLRFRAGERSAGWSLLVRLKDGQRTRIKLGTWPKMGISDARIAARNARGEIAIGRDPNEEKREATRQAAIDARNRITLGEVLTRYDKEVLSHHRSGGNTRRSLDGKSGLLTTLANRLPSSITRDEVANLVRKHAKSGPIGANRKLAYASAFFNWCIDEHILEVSPAANIRKPGRETERDRFHTLDELREIWAATGTLGYPFEQLYRLIITTPMRREEIAGIPVAELQLGSDDAPDDAMWTLPSDRTKRANALRIPLSWLARSIIVASLKHPDRPKESKFLFTTTTETSVSGFTKAKRRLDAAILERRKQVARERGDDEKAVEPMPHWTVHDLRTSFNTHGCELLDIPPHVADRILNHVATATRSKIMRVYNKSELLEPRRNALRAWADLLEREVIGG